MNSGITNEEIFNIVIPTFNEGNNVLKIVREIKNKSKELGIKVRIWLINDCSDDELTILNIEKVVDNIEVFSSNTSMKNKGQHIATKLGFTLIGNGVTGVLDCDGQDPVEDLFNMYDILIKSKYEAIIGIRGPNSRKGTDSIFKIYTASLYYKLISLILKKKVYNSSNFYIIKLTRDKLKYLSTDNLRQSVQDNFNYTTYEYNRHKREIGKTKYTVLDLVKVAFMGVRYSIKERKKSHETKTK